MAFRLGETFPSSAVEGVNDWHLQYSALGKIAMIREGELAC